MEASWAAMAAAGNPGTVLPWSRYDPALDNYLAIDEHSEIKNGYRTPECDKLDADR
jgi:hypothetical protein